MTEQIAGDENPASADEADSSDETPSGSETVGSRGLLTEKKSTKKRSEQAPVDVADILAIVGFAVLLLANFGAWDGFGFDELTWPLMSTVLLLPAAALGWSRLRWKWWPAAFLAAPLIAALTAGYRSDVVADMAWVAVVATGSGAVVHLRKRPWFSTVALVGLGLVTVRWTATGLWGFVHGEHNVASGSAQFLPLSWHNQSAVLMAGLSCAWLTVALTTRTKWSYGAAAAAALTAGVLPLTGSRAGTASIVVGVAIVLYLVWPRKVQVIKALVVFAVGAAVVVGAGTAFLAQKDSAASAFGEREETAAGNAVHRLRFWETAGELFLERPLTGWGPGSFLDAQLERNADNAPQATSVHNEWLEIAAEGGLLWLGAVAATGVIVVAGARKVRKGGDVWRLAAIGAASPIVAHMTVDFDIRYPILAAIVAVGIGAAVEARSDKPRRWAPSAVSAVLVVGLLAGSVPMAWVQHTAAGAGDGSWSTRTPWNLSRTGLLLDTVIMGGQMQWALDIARQRHAWNPSDSTLEAVQEMHDVELEGKDPGELTDMFTSQNRVNYLPMYTAAVTVLGRNGHLQQAREVADVGLRRYVNPSARLRVHLPTLISAALLVENDIGGCPAVNRMVDRIRDEYPGDSEMHKIADDVAGDCRES